MKEGQGQSPGSMFPFGKREENDREASEGSEEGIPGNNWEVNF